MTHDKPLPLLKAPTFWGLLQARVLATPDATMLIDGHDRRLSFAAYAHAAEGLAAWLYQRGLRAGQHVTWQFPTRLESAILVAALARLGVVQNPVIHLYRERELRSVLRHSHSRFLIVPQQVADRDLVAMANSLVQELNNPPEVIVLGESLPTAPVTSLPPVADTAEDATWVFYTSGTTAEPKGALHRDASIMGAGVSLALSYQFAADDVGSIAFPIAHIGGSVYLSLLLACGGSAVLLESFVPEQVVALFNRYGVNNTGGSTAHYLALLAEQARQPDVPLIPSLRVLGGGGAPKPPELFFRCKREMRVTICHSYGMTECPGLTMAPMHASDEQLAYTDGRPTPDVEVRIVRLDGQVAAYGEEGEIRIRGRGVFLGYTDPALDAQAFDEQGYFRTGDLGVIRADGHLSVTGRLKDVIIRKGENVSAREIEDLLYTHPKVRGAAVIGLPDAERGERICAVVELHGGVAPLSFEEMVEHFRQAEVMRQKIPEQLELVEQLPRSDALGKVLKNKLKEQFGRA